MNFKKKIKSFLPSQILKNFKVTTSFLNKNNNQTFKRALNSFINLLEKNLKIK